jgi:hypothetical protein
MVIGPPPPGGVWLPRQESVLHVAWETLRREAGDCPPACGKGLVNEM